MRHIELNHPTYELTDGKSADKYDEDAPDLTYSRFGLCGDLGTLRSHCECCPQQTTEMAKQLGVGPTLFLMSTKALSCFFIFLTILNIPVIGFYYLGNSSDNQISQFTDIFALTSMGNVGQSGYSCGEVNVKNVYEKDPTEFGIN